MVVGGFDGFHVGVGKFAATFLKDFLRLINQRVRPVARFDLFLFPLVFIGVGFGFPDHLVDVVLGQAAGSSDGDLLLLSRTEIFRRDVHDSVRIDIEGHLDLRNTTRSRRKSNQLELA